MSQAPLRIIFAGTPDFAVEHLQALLTHNYSIVAVLTQPDRPAGRGKKPLMSPVKQLALQHAIPVLQPNSLHDTAIQSLLSQYQSDLMVVVAYGLILPESVLSLSKYGCINVHGSLLPRWRGAAPIQRAIWAGDQTTGITVIQMDKGLDTGAILYQETCIILPTETSASLYVKLAKLGAFCLLQTLKLLSNNVLQAIQQPTEQISYAKKLTKEEAKLDWSLPANQLEQQIRAFNPWPISYFLYDGQPIKVWEANVIQVNVADNPGTIIAANKTGLQIATGEKILNITSLQPAGKNKMPAVSFLSSRKNIFLPGMQLNE